MHLEYSPSLNVGRTSSTATNCSSKVWKIRPAVLDLHNESTEPFCIPYARFPRQSDMYFKMDSFSICPILHRPPKVHCRDFFKNPRSNCSRPSFATPSSRPTRSFLHTVWKVCQFHLVSRSSPICSVSVLCHSVHIHSSNAHTLAQHCMRAYSSPRWQLQWEAFKYTVCIKYGRSKLPVFSFSAHFYSYCLLFYLYYMTYRLLQKPASVAVAVAAVIVHSYR